MLWSSYALVGECEDVYVIYEVIFILIFLGGFALDDEFEIDNCLGHLTIYSGGLSNFELVGSLILHMFNPIHPGTDRGF